MRTEKLIYIIDDDKDLCDMMKLALQARHHNVQCAFDGESGQELIKKKAPDLIVLDLKMPRMNGYELLAWIKTQSDCANVPIVILTSLTMGTQKSDEEWRTSMEVDGFFTKPLEPHELLETISALLNG
jgi:DNA-binding response OmpR family regulator